MTPRALLGMPPPGALRGGSDLVRALGLNAFRFSIEWSRIEPIPGNYKDAALDHYRRVLLACRARGITPVVTLHHFTNPRWFAALGGWEDRRNLSHFVRFVRLAAERYGTRSITGSRSTSRSARVWG
jgi:beta-glucosidase